MTLTVGDLQKLINRIFYKIKGDAERANDAGEIEIIFDAYGISIEEQPLAVETNRRSKILVVGALNGNKKDYILAAKKLGVPEECLVFVEYGDAKRLSAEQLRYSTVYSDIICGAMPHRTIDSGDGSSFILCFENLSNKNEYPNLIRAVTYTDELKLSLTSFKQALLKTRYISNLVDV